MSGSQKDPEDPSTISGHTAPSGFSFPRAPGPLLMEDSTQAVRIAFPGGPGETQEPGNLRLPGGSPYQLMTIVLYQNNPGVTYKFQRMGVDP